MSNNKYNVAKLVIALIDNDRLTRASYSYQMREYLLKVIEIKRANDPSPRAGRGYFHQRHNAACGKTGSPSNDRADDYYEHGSH